VKITYKNIKEPILSIQEAFLKEPERVSNQFVEVFGHKTLPLVVGDVEGIKLLIFMRQTSLDYSIFKSISCG